MIVIGLTGGIGSGKSTVSSYLRMLQIPVFDADVSSRSAVAKGSDCLAAVTALLGTDCLLETGELNRPLAAQRVFADPALLKKFEKLVQDQVWKDAMNFLGRHREQNTPIVVLDVPLLIESGWYRSVDQVWLVNVSRKIQLERAMLRDHATRAEIMARIEAQMPLEEKLTYADVVIDNTGSLEETKKQVRTFLRRVAGKT